MMDSVGSMDLTGGVDSQDALCPECGGAGMVLAVNAAGQRVARVCECEEAVKSGYRVSAARIPLLHRHCSLDSFETGFSGADPSLRLALMTARRFVKAFPVETDGRGLLITGPIGVGKTHLAVGILMALIQERGAQVLFCDYRELLKEIQRSYNPQVNATEFDVLRPILDAEVLVLDELGAQKPTDWVWDTVGLILNSRYKDKRTTIITTNYADLPSGAQKEESLGDRIGDRMWSRLSEMCVCVEMNGGDFRQGPKRARFG
jgi:DNA replication protein DnaC